MATRVLIMGAAGRDFHVFNTCFRDDPDSLVLAFTAAQIPNIAGRRYPPALAGPRYPNGVPIYPEDRLASLIREDQISRVIFAYSDVSYREIDAKREIVEGAGARFELFDVDRTMLASSRPVVAVCAVRTGCGKSQTSRRVVEILRARGRRVAVVRHPMPYGDLEKQAVQRFATREDLSRHQCTIEEREEYEPHIAHDTIVFAGVDYERILRAAEAESDVVLWDGGNNDTPFFRPDLWIVVADPLRPNHEVGYFPGRVNFERADVVLLNKMDQATPQAVETIEANLKRLNPRATLIRANSAIRVDNPDAIRGKRALVIEDGPSVTHGGARYGAGTLAARRFGASGIVDPRPYAVGSLIEVFRHYNEIGPILPAMGYGQAQIRELERTINASDAEVVIIGTPIDLGKLIRIDKPHVRVTYDLEEIGRPNLEEVLGKL